MDLLLWLDQGRPYQRYDTPDGIVLRIIGTRKSFHHDKVMIRGKVTMQSNSGVSHWIYVAEGCFYKGS